MLLLTVGALGDVVVRLVSALNHKCAIYTDSAYTSLPLARKLNATNKHSIGVIMSNREEVPGVLAEACKVLKPHERIALVDKEDNFVLHSYKDKKPVTMLSTQHGTGTNNDVPSCLHDYRHHMGAVDRFNQHLAYVSSARRCFRW